MSTLQKAIETHAARAVRLAQETTQLDLLADIDATVDALLSRTRKFRAMMSVFIELESEVSASDIKSGTYIDPDFRLTDALESAESVLETYLPRMTVKRATIDKDMRLSAEHRESLHDAYEAVMTEAAFLHDAIQSARAAIITHDLEAEPRDELPTFDTVESLIADLHGH